LEKRRKYKCAKCGKLFSQKEIENEEFREWNKVRRKEDRKENEKQRYREIYQRKKRLRLQNKKEDGENKISYYKRNQEKIIQQKREYRKGLSGQRKKEENEKRNARRHSDVEGTRLNSRINYWRQQQRNLALLQLENDYEKAYDAQLSFILPTYVLPHLL